MEQSFQHDLAGVRVHADRATGLAAQAMGAAAFALGTHVGFARGRYDPHSGAGRALLAHELAHVVQQTGAGAGSVAGSGASLESEADAAASAVSRGAPAPALSTAAPAVQRRVEFRDVGRGEHSGFARRQELVDRLSDISRALIFDLDAAGVLSYIENPYETATEFDRQMQALIDDEARVIPLRLTNRRGALRDANTGPFNIPVIADSWTTGYVDIDDLLASDDLGLQSTLLHILTERIETSNYARRMGSNTFSEREFNRVHALGIEAEVRFMRDFFGDPDIAHDPRRPGNVAVQFRTGRPAGAARRDIIRMRFSSGGRGEQAGIQRMTVDVVLADGTVMSADDYRALRRRERAPAPVPAAVPAVAPPP